MPIWLALSEVQHPECGLPNTSIVGPMAPYMSYPKMPPAVELGNDSACQDSGQGHAEIVPSSCFATSMVEVAVGCDPPVAEELADADATTGRKRVGLSSYMLFKSR